MTEESKQLTPELAGHLKSLKLKLGPEVADDLEKVFKEMLTGLGTVAKTSKVDSSALFIARPSGYVD